MANRFNGILLLSAVLVASLVEGWGSAKYALPPLRTESIELASDSFPLNPDQGWFVKPSLLVWRPYQHEIDPGSVMLVGLDSSVTEEKLKVQNIRFRWGTGARLTLGRYLPNHEQWDLGLTSTYFYSDAEKEIHGNNSSSPSRLITEGWNPEILGMSLKTHVSWQINYFTWDLAIGRLYSLTPKIVVHPFLCLRTALFFEEYTDRNFTTAFQKTKFHLEEAVWGMGPRIGSDFSFYFGHRWSLLGSLSGSIVMGRYNLHEKINGFFSTPPNAGPSVRAKIRDADTNMHANLEGMIGLGWEKWVRDGTVRLAPSFWFEVTEWFLLNNWVATAIPSTTGSPDWGMTATRRMGNLGFLGFTLNLQIDF